METEKRPVSFRDLAEFVDNKARVSSNPVFGKIEVDTKSKQDRKESLMRQLGANGARTQIALRTLEKNDSLTDSFVVIRSGREHFHRPASVAHKTRNTFLKGGHIDSKRCRPMATRVEVHLPDTVEAEIGLLIACDVPAVFDPLEVRYSEDGGP